MNKDIQRTSLKNNMIWNSLGSIVYQAVIWLMSYIYVLQAGHAENGILVIAMTTTNMFFTIAIYGMRAYQSSDITGAYTDKEYIYSRYITCFVALVLCVGVSALNYDISTLIIISLYMVFRLTEAFTDVLHGIDQRVMRMDIVGKSFILRGVVSIISFVACIYVTNSLLIALLVMSAISFLIVVFYDVPNAKKLGDFSQPAKLQNVKKLIIECLPLVVYAFLNTVIANLPRLVLEDIQDEQAISIFMAISAPAVVIQLGATYIFTPLISGISTAFITKDKLQYKKILLRTCLAISVVGIIGVIGGFVLGDWGLTLLYSSDKSVYDGVMQNAGLLVPVIITAAVTAMVLFFNMVLTIIRDFKGLIISTVTGSLFCLAVSVPLINLLSLQGANLALLASLIIQLICLLVFGANKCKKHFNS